MIPKRIFYVWFGGEKTAMANICIQNWREKLPDYEIIELNENSSYFDFKKAYRDCLWFKSVYDRKMWAYVADYVRCKVLYDHGGIYFDTDVTVVKSLDNLLNNDFFAGYEKENLINGAIMGCTPKHTFMKDMIDFYHNEIFKSSLYAIPTIITELIKRNNYKNITIFPREYFYPFNPFANKGETFTPECVTENTYTIHWWNASWVKDDVLFFLENKHKYTLQKLEQLQDHVFKSVRLFNFLPIAKYYLNAQEVRICGVPIFTKITDKNKNVVTNIKLFRHIPFWKEKQKATGTKYYLFGVPLFKII